MFQDVHNLLKPLRPGHSFQHTAGTAWRIVRQPVSDSIMTVRHGMRRTDAVNPPFATLTTPAYLPSTPCAGAHPRCRRLQ